MPQTKVANIPQQMLDIYSRELLMAALPRMLFRQFVTVKREFGVEPGERMLFTKYDNLTKGGKIANEDADLTPVAMSGSAVYISMSEFGNAAGFSRRASKASLRDLMEDAKRLLGRDYSLVMDEYLRDVFLTTANKFYALNTGQSGANVAAVNGKFDATTLDSLVEMAKNLNMPKLSRGADNFYAFIGTPHQIRQLRNSSGWEKTRMYVDPADMLNGEVGRLNDVICFDTTQMPITAGAGAGGVNVHRGVFIGADCVGFGESVPVELIPGEVTNYGRKQSIAWYSIAGAGILNDYLIDVYTAEGL